MQTVENLGVKQVLSYTHELYGKYDVQKIYLPFYIFLRDDKEVLTVPESEIKNGTVSYVNPVPDGHKNRRATRKARRNRKNYSRTN